MVVSNYCAYAHGFVNHLAHRKIPVADVTEAQVEQYLRETISLFQRRHGRLPGPRWHQIPCTGIHALLRLVQGRWPPATNAPMRPMRCNLGSATSTRPGNSNDAVPKA